jgi:sterol 3beta-glucosyltransferase
VRIGIVCNDTKGGVLPYVALGAGLRAAGHRVTVVAPEDFASAVLKQRLAFAPLSGSQEQIAEISAGAAERGTLSTMRLMLTELPKRVRQWTRETLDGCGDAELIIAGIGGMVTGLPVAEKLGVPFVEAQLQPVGVPTSVYPGVLLAGWPLWRGRFGRRLSHLLSDAAIGMQFAGAARTARRDVLKLKGAGKRPDPRLRLFGFSQHVVPMPRSLDVAVCGYWTMDEPDWTPPAELGAFLARDDRPVVSVGFGSMTSASPSLLAHVVSGAAADAGVRAVLLGGWAGLSIPESADVYVADAIPHSWLFPRMAAVVHHGGAGTTGAAFIAGVPQIVVPFAVDQPFWGKRVEVLGVGPKSIPRGRLTRLALARALTEAVKNTRCRDSARQLGTAIAAERGVEQAVSRLNASGLIR